MNRWFILGGIAIIAGFVLRTSLCGCGSTTDTARLFVETSIKVPLAAFRRDVGRYPTTAEGLAGLLRKPPTAGRNWKGPYIDAPHVPLDPWGHEYRYRSPGAKNPTAYDVWSLGPDGVEGADDIGNW